MRGHRLLATALIAALAGAGCQGTGTLRRPRTVASTEPGLEPSPGSSTVIASTPPPSTVTFVDRHPLFSKPREYYENSGNNTIVKAAAATVIGIPAGLYGEMRQIVVGQPSPPY
jgi:hypothetical protein